MIAKGEALELAPPKFLRPEGPTSVRPETNPNQPGRIRTNPNKAKILALLTALLLIAGCNAPKNEPKTIVRPGEPPVARVEEKGPEMDAAIAKARATVDEFIAETGSPGTREFYIKAPFPDDRGGMEHIWIGELSYEDGTFGGKLANEPLAIKGMKKGDHVMVRKEEITDWMIVDGEKTTGAFTTEELTKREGTL